MFDVGQGSVRLTWRPASLPSHVKSTSPITYTIFVQELPFKTWRPLVKKIPHTSYYLSGLQLDKEYNFRIQAENEHRQSRPTEAVYLPKYTGKKLSCYLWYNPLLHKYSFWRINNRQLWKTLWEKKKLLVRSNFFISHKVFY